MIVNVFTKIVTKMSSNIKFTPLLDYFFNHNCSILINEITDNNILDNDIFIIDNVHDLSDKRTSEYQYLTNDIKKYIINLLSQYSKEKLFNKKQVDVNGDMLKTKILKLHNIINITSVRDELPDFETIRYNNRGKDIYNNIMQNEDAYLETSGIFTIANSICPYKNALDEASCGNDDVNVRKNMKLKTKLFNLKNYDTDNSVISLEIIENDDKILDEESIKINIRINNMGYYKLFITLISDENYMNTKIVIVEDEPCIIQNSIKTIIEYLNICKDAMEDDENFYKYALAGMHLKRMGDHAQVDIFRKSDMTYFQTIDFYCFIHACRKIKYDKVVIFGKKIMVTKVKHNNVKYLMSFTMDDSERCVFVNTIMGMLDKLITTINETNQSKKIGGALLVYDNKIDIKNKSDYTYNKSNNMIKQLVEDINNIYNNGVLPYLVFKTRVNEYKKTFGTMFDEIYRMIEMLKDFTIKVDPYNILRVKRLYEDVIYFEKYFNVTNDRNELIINDNEKYYINVIKKNI